jgi:hypothetical protein
MVVAVDQTGESGPVGDAGSPVSVVQDREVTVRTVGFDAHRYL